MILKVYSIYDRVAGSYSELFTALRDELAIRRFGYLMKNSPMVATDCDLFLLGSYDMEKGFIVPCEKPEFVYRYEEGVNV